MWNAMQRILPGAMVLAAMVWSTFPGPAGADVKAKHVPGTCLNEITIKPTVDGVTFGPYVFTEGPPSVPCPDSMCVLVFQGAFPGSRVWASACVWPPTTYPGGNTKTIINTSVFATLDASAGGNTIEAAPDTLCAGVGLYTETNSVSVSTTANGTTTLTRAAGSFVTDKVRPGDAITGGVPAPPSGTIVVRVDSPTSLTMSAAIAAGAEPQARTIARVAGPKAVANTLDNALGVEVELVGDGPGGVQDAVLITLKGGGLQTRVLAGTSHQAVAGMKLAVYKSNADAVADVGTLGVGAAYFGKTDLIGASGQLVFTQGMESGDWTVASDGPGKYTAQPVPGRTKTVLVPDKNTAVVALVGDPRSSTTLPGQSPLGLVLLSIALLAAGIWMMRSRTAAAA